MQYTPYSFPQMWKFLFMPRFIPKQILLFAKRNPNRRPFFRFILGRSIACWFILFRHWYCYSILSLRFVYSVHVRYNSCRILAQGWSILFTVDSMHSIVILYKSLLTNLVVGKTWFSQWIFVSPFTSFKEISFDKFDSVDFLITVFSYIVFSKERFKLFKKMQVYVNA